jgi:hypothetical protein
MNKRLVDVNCKEKTEVLAIGQEGSIKDLETKLKACFECSSFVGCFSMIHLVKSFNANLENLEYMQKKIIEEQKLY